MLYNVHNLNKELINSMNTIAIQHNLFRLPVQGWANATAEYRGSKCEDISPMASLVCDEYEPM